MLEIHKMNDKNDLETLGMFFIRDIYEEDEEVFYGLDIPFLEDIIKEYSPIVIDAELFFESIEECERIIKHLEKIRKIYVENFKELI
jgi:hypothetical protein